VEVSHTKTILKVLEKCGELKFSVLMYAKASATNGLQISLTWIWIRDIISTNPEKHAVLKRLHISGLILTAYIKCVTSFVECQIHGSWGTQIPGARSSG
jgi:hypothetical protein